MLQGMSSPGFHMMIPFITSGKCGVYVINCKRVYSCFLCAYYIEKGILLLMLW